MIRFFNEKRVEITSKDSTQKVHKKGSKRFFILQILRSIVIRRCSFISLGFDHQ